MNVINLKDYLLDCSQEEITKRLMKLDASIMSLHKKGFFVVGFDANNIKLYDGELSLASFNNKLDRLDSGFNPEGDKKDILEMCAVGICAYNGFANFYINDNVIEHLIKNFDAFCNNGKIPNIVYEYYQSVMVNGEYDYLNNFIYKKQHENASSNQVLGNSNRLTKTTAIGKAFAEKENAAYVNVLLLPALSTLIIIVIIVGYFVLMK